MQLNYCKLEWLLNGVPTIVNKNKHKAMWVNRSDLQLSWGFRGGKIQKDSSRKAPHLEFEVGFLGLIIY